MISCPRDLVYFPFQIEGIRFAASRPGSLIGDEMGTGKTIQAIGLMNCHPEWARVLVVCPASLTINWQREVSRWMVSPCVEVTITSYGKLSELDSSVVYDLAVLDEAHYIKEMTALRSGLCRTIRARRKLALTGTPLLNRPIDIWHILHWLRPDIWPKSSYDLFGVRYGGGKRKKINRRGDTRPDYLGASNIDELREKVLAPLMIRRLKKDVLKDLPSKRPPQIIELPASGLDAQLRKEMAEAAASVERTIESFRGDVQALHDAIEAEWNRFSVLRHAAGRATVPMAVPLIADAIESLGKVIVFAYHRDVIEALAEALREFNPVVVQGGMSAEQKQSAVDEFQKTGSASRVFIGQIVAAGVGLTLTAAHHVIFAEMDWTPGVMAQAEDRAHRIGQTEPVTVQYLVLENSLDIRMLKGIVRKQKVIDKALGAEKKQEEIEWWI